MEEICEDLLSGGDTGVFLVAITEQIQSKKWPTPESAADVIAKTLLLKQYETILSRLGWDLLMVFSPHLHPSHHHSWQLLHQITTVCSPKEMVLALLEQMEGLAVRKPLLVFMALDVLKKVLARVTSRSVVESTLRSTFRVLKPLLTSASSVGTRVGTREEGEEEEEEDEGETTLEGGETRVEGEEGRVEGEETRVEGEETRVEGEEGRETRVEGEEVKVEGEEGRETRVEGEEGRETSKVEGAVDGAVCEVVPLGEAVMWTLDFVRPFSEAVHSEYMDSNGGGWGWTQTQRNCTAMLLSLLDYPLVKSNLHQHTSPQRSSTTTPHKMAALVMSALVRAHCGCSHVLSWKPPKLAPHDPDMAETEPPVSLPEVGVGCFAYLLFAEGVESSYLPLVHSMCYLFHTVLRHARVLMERQENSVVKKGLELLQALLSRTPDHTLPSHMLDHKIYTDVVQTLINHMTLSQLKSIRQTSIKLFQGLLAKFEENGRHRYHRSLFRLVSHSGVKGLLIHAVKDEVDSALKTLATDGKGSVFLGCDLAPLLDLVLRADQHMELMKEFDSLMSALNFLRYLLIRDKQELNQTGVWDSLGSVSARFLTPLRQLLTEKNAQCRHEMHLKSEEAAEGARASSASVAVGAESEPRVSVEIMNDETLPSPSLQDQIQILQVAQQQMGMMESVLVRVEDLMTVQKTTSCT